MDSQASPQIEALVGAADTALAGRKPVEALLYLERAVALDAGSFDLWMRLASLRRVAGSGDSALAAVEAALALRPLDFLALLMRAHLLEQAGMVEADEVYGYALAQVPLDRASLAPTVVRMLEHAQRRYDAFVATREAILAKAMADVDAGATADERRRLDRFRSNVLRRTRVYHSEPTDYFYPGLIEREFHDRGDFPWIADLEATMPVIREELQALLASDAGELTPYVQYPAHVPMRQWAALNHSRDWTAVHLLARGQRVAANADRCPRTMAALAKLPQPRIPAYGPNAMFSWLAPGAHIPPHTGVANTRLICHLPLVVPAGCWFRVGAERREWREGEAFVFDDSIEHEAANESTEPRVVLIFDVWHPLLSAVERDGVAALLAAGGRAGRAPQGAL